LYVSNDVAALRRNALESKCESTLLDYSQRKAGADAGNVEEKLLIVGLLYAVN